MNKTKSDFLVSLAVLAVSIPIGAFLGVALWYVATWFALSVDDSSLMYKLEPLPFILGGAALCFAITLVYWISGKLKIE